MFFFEISDSVVKNGCSYHLARKKNLGIVALKILLKTKRFWKPIKPFFTDKCSTADNIILTENNYVKNDDKEIANTLNEYFTNVTSKLNLRQYGNSSLDNEVN